MNIDSNCIAVDSDFLNHISETAGDITDIASMLKRVSIFIEKKLFMNPLVYDKEILIDEKNIQEIIAQQLVVIPSFDDIFQEDKEKREYYVYLIPELFKYLNGINYPENKDVFQYWISQKNLGEVHSIATCLICDCPIMLSDDEDAQKLSTYVEQKFLHNIKVYSRKGLIQEYGKVLEFSRKQRRAFAHEAKS